MAAAAGSVELQYDEYPMEEDIWGYNVSAPVDNCFSEVAYELQVYDIFEG